MVEQDGKLQKVTATLSPKIYFKDGKAEKIWVNLTNVEGPAGIKATLQTAAQLADTLGLFPPADGQVGQPLRRAALPQDLSAAGFHHSKPKAEAKARQEIAARRDNANVCSPRLAEPSDRLLSHVVAT